MLFDIKKQISSKEFPNNSTTLMLKGSSSGLVLPPCAAPWNIFVLLTAPGAGGLVLPIFTQFVNGSVSLDNFAGFVKALFNYSYYCYWIKIHYREGGILNNV